MSYFISAIKKISCHFLVMTLTTSVVSAAWASPSPKIGYYYQAGQISAINTAMESTSYLLAGSDRVATIPVASSVDFTARSGQYYLGDGKNHNLMFSISNSHSFAMGNTVQSSDYQPYGHSHQLLSKNVSSSFAYNGEYQDPATRLTYLRARDYDANSQRFMTMDSYNLWNRYAFASGDPISNTDPSGHMSQNGLSLLVGIGVSVGVTLARSFEGGADPGEIPFKRMATRGLFIAGNTVPAAMLAYHNFSQGQTTAGIGAALVAASGLAGTVSAQAEIMLDAAEHSCRLKMADEPNMAAIGLLDDQVKKWITASSMASQGLMAVGSALQIQSNVPAWQNPLVYASALAGLAAGGIYGYVSNKMFTGGGLKSPSWSEMTWGDLSQKAALGAIRSGFTGLIASAPVDIYEGIHGQMSAGTIAEGLAIPFAMGMVSGATQVALYGSQTGFNSTFLLSSGGRMAYLFVKPPLWSAITSGNLGDLFH